MPNGSCLAPMADICWRRSSEHATRCPACGVRCRADQDNHHERTTCAHYLGPMSAAEACALVPTRGQELVAQATAGQPEASGRWHVFMIPYRGR